MDTITTRRVAPVAAGAFTALAVIASTLLGGLSAAAEETPIAETPAVDVVETPAEPLPETAEAEPEPTPDADPPVARADAPVASLVPGDGPAADVQVDIVVTANGSQIPASFWIRHVDGSLYDYGATDVDDQDTKWLVPGAYIVEAQAYDSAYAPEFWGGAHLFEDAAVLTVLPGQTHLLEIEVDRWSPVNGTVVFADGTPAVDHELRQLTLDGTVLRTPQVTATGAVAFPAWGGQYHLEVLDPSGVLLGYVGPSAALSATPVPFGVTDLGTEVQFHVVLGAAEEPEECVDPVTREPIPCDDPEEPEHCEGEYDGSEYDCQEPGEECDPTVENCMPTEECDPTWERCGDPGTECDEWTEECDPELPTYPHTETETELETLAHTGAPITVAVVTALALLLGGVIVLAARRRTTA